MRGTRSTILQIDDIVGRAALIRRCAPPSSKGRRTVFLFWTAVPSRRGCRAELTKRNATLRIRRDGGGQRIPASTQPFDLPRARRVQGSVPFFLNGAAKAASLLSRRAAADLSPGQRPGIRCALIMSHGVAKSSWKSFAPTALTLQATSNPGLCPGLRSVAALRLQSGAIRAKLFWTAVPRRR